MNDDKRSTLQYFPVMTPVRTIRGLAHRMSAAQTDARLSVWEGEGGAIERHAVAAPSLRAGADLPQAPISGSKVPERGILRLPAGRSDVVRSPTRRPKLRGR